MLKGVLLCLRQRPMHQCTSPKTQIIRIVRTGSGKYLICVVKCETSDKNLMETWDIFTVLWGGKKNMICMREKKHRQGQQYILEISRVVVRNRHA